MCVPRYEERRGTFLLKTLLRSLMYVTSPSSSLGRFRDHLERLSRLWKVSVGVVLKGRRLY